MSSGPTAPIELSSVDELAKHYDVFLIDQFGVLHNGTAPFSGSPEALHRLHQAGKRCVIISNSGKRASINRLRLARLGYPADCYTSVVTSGEVAWQYLQAACTAGEIKADARCFLLTNNGDKSPIEGLELTLVEEVADAQLVLLAGMGIQMRSLAEYLTMFEPVIAHNIPCICTNPDKVAITATGKHFSVGTIAAELEQRGAQMLWIGKPYPQIYQSILESLEISDGSGVVCIGDSIEHDIVGGASAGLATALVRTGILDELNDNEREALYSQFQVRPNYLLSSFW